MSDSRDNIIDLDVTTEVTHTSRNETCRHYRKRIDRDQRVVSCRDCKAPLDPMDCLISVTGDVRYWERIVRQNRTEALAAGQRLEDLKRQERNAKVRLAKGRAKDPVEQFKAELLAKIARAVDLAHDKGEYHHVGHLRGLELVCVALLEGRSLASFVRKIRAAQEEIEARERRKRLHVVGAKRPEATS